MYTSNYFNYLEKSASPQVRRELQEMKRKPSSFSSVQDVIKKRYGSKEKTSTSYPHPTPSQKTHQ